ncbi:LysR family transcriptional regulator [Croceicoccus ponticola]|uniref:LysR family transcriptional regulator n=1 Tax=Croceicoccus ponticola TaxID=2217664 RepID=A0A437H2H5_9SPHN|nr:LysR substrate-binding domain-containing protein [Croceicoccus ponticola]RVQ69673.1 LysR family transcriptional regulator [Croceicoccus ponticola]
MFHISYKSLRYFVATAEELHFRRAAERLGITQPPLSIRIRQLEDDIGSPLFERDRRNVRLTKVGAVLLEEARPLLAQTELLSKSVERAAMGEVGEIRIGVTQSVALMGKVPRVLRQFRREYPDVRLTLVEMLSNAQLVALREDRIDVGFVRIPGTLATTQTDFQAIPVETDELALYLPSDHALAKTLAPVDMEELANETFVFYEREVATGLHEPLLALCKRHGFEPRIEQQAREPTTIIGLVSSGFGITILPRSFTRIGQEGVVVRAISDPGPPIKTWLTSLSDNRSALIRRFCGHFENLMT